MSGNVEFARQLGKQLRFLERACRDYDAGDRDVAVLIATHLSTIFHDGQESHSLLRHMNAKGIRLLSTCWKYPEEWLRWPIPNLTRIRMCPAINLFESIPNVQDAGTGRFLPFAQWWSETIYRSGSSGTKLKRPDLVTWARNKDGGGHVDAKFPVQYQQLVDFKGFEMLNRLDGEPEIELKLREVHLATLRQIAFETLNSPELIAMAESYEPAPSPEEMGLMQGGPSVLPGCEIVYIRFGKRYD